MLSVKIDLTLEQFMAQFSTHRDVARFDREAVEVILKRLEAHQSDDFGDAGEVMSWNSFFIYTDILDAEAIINMPAWKIKISDDQVRLIDELKTKDYFGDDYEARAYAIAKSIAGNNGWHALSNNKFLT